MSLIKVNSIEAYTGTSVSFNNDVIFTNISSGVLSASLGIDANGKIVSGSSVTSTSDIYVTGGTYSSGTAIFTNNTGGTFSVTGFNVGSSLNYWTSGSTGNFSLIAINDSGLDATGSYALAEGSATIASGFASHAEGNSSVASGQNSHAEGQNSIAIGNASHAEGSSTASGASSHSEGFLTQAIGNQSHAEGKLTIASGQNSHAEGESTIASGDNSHAGGLTTEASGLYSFVHGISSQANGVGTIVLGNSIIGSSNDTVYVNNLIINNLTSGTSVSSLGVSASGEIISGNTNISNALYTVNADLNANNTSTATTSVLIYGVNVFTGVTSTDYATKLPQPVTGKSVKVINNGTTFLFIFPANIGGRINNLPIDTPAVIPPDGNLYEFICIKNPLPGEWTFSTPATGQYDSGDISISISAGTYSGLNPIVSAYDSTRVYITNQFSSVNWGYNGKNKSNLITTNYGSGKYTVAFRPETPWKGISKIKVYTNLLTDSAKATQVRLLAGGESGYYSPFDSTMLNSAVVGDNNELFVFNLNNKIAGSSSTGSTIFSSANVGDNGTVWSESVAFSDPFSMYTDVSLGGVGGTFIGNKSLGVAPYPYGQTWDNTGNEINTGDSVDVYYSSFISFQIKPFQEYFNYGVIPDFKFRFIIEYYQ